jgi:hypothetical protein
MGSETAERLGPVGVSRTSGFLFLSCENSLVAQRGRRESARGHSLSQEVK